MIRSFRDGDSKRLSDDQPVRRYQSFQKAVRRKLEMIEATEALGDLQTPPGNRLEALKGKRKGQHSIRINGQWRICFRWKADCAHDVETSDYH